MRDRGTGRLFSPTAHEPAARAGRRAARAAAVTPLHAARRPGSLALDYLRELSADIRSGVVLARTARCWRARRSSPSRRATSGAAGDAAEMRGETADGAVYAGRSDSHALAVVCGRFALPSLIRYDLRLVLADLAGGDRPEAACDAAPAARPTAPRRGPVGAARTGSPRAREPRVVLTDRGAAGRWRRTTPPPTLLEAANG